MRKSCHGLRRVVTLVLGCATFILGACAPELPPVSVQEPIQGGVAFLKRNYNPAIGLIRESPQTAPDRYWLTTDNWFAVRALRAVGEDEFAREIERHLAQYDTARDGCDHGLIEVLDCADIRWPPSTPDQISIVEQVWCEKRQTAEAMKDWRAYSDLALYGALRAHCAGDRPRALERYRMALDHFDGVGFKDKAFAGHYATYKVALAIYVADVLGVPPDRALLNVLLSKQASDGGFTAQYGSDGAPVGDANTETTSLAILALSRYLRR